MLRLAQISVWLTGAILPLFSHSTWNWLWLNSAALGQVDSHKHPLVAMAFILCMYLLASWGVVASVFDFIIWVENRISGSKKL
jgi:hypothetical protein